MLDTGTSSGGWQVRKYHLFHIYCDDVEPLPLNLGMSFVCFIQHQEK